MEQLDKIEVVLYYSTGRHMSPAQTPTSYPSLNTRVLNRYFHFKSNCLHHTK